MKDDDEARAVVVSWIGFALAMAWIFGLTWTIARIP